MVLGAHAPGRVGHRRASIRWGSPSGGPHDAFEEMTSHVGSPSTSPYGVNMATIGGANAATPAASRRASRSSLQKGGAELPRWVRDELVRVTPKERRDAALQLLTCRRRRLLRGPLPCRHVETARDEDALPTHGDGARIARIECIPHRPVEDRPQRVAHLSAADRRHHPYARGDGLAPRPGPGRRRDQDMGALAGARRFPSDRGRGPRRVRIVPARPG